jgi:sugar phosphate isomerase/epimerase
MPPATPSAFELAFSTLACPEWQAPEIVARAAVMGYDAIEWRGGRDGHVRTTWSRSERAALRRRLADAGVRSLAVTSYSNLVADDPAAVRASADDLVAHAELAADLGARFVRAFLGRHDRPDDPHVLARAADALRTTVHRIGPTGVAIAVEPHDEFVRGAVVASVLDAVGDPFVGAVWDVGNAWALGEPPAETFAALGRHVRYVQVKDGTGRDETWQLTNLGVGDVPLAEAIRLLTASGPLPPISVEWERAWDSRLAPAELALPQAAELVRSLVRSGARRSANPLVGAAR